MCLVCTDACDGRHGHFVRSKKSSCKCTFLAPVGLSSAAASALERTDFWSPSIFGGPSTVEFPSVVSFSIGACRLAWRSLLQGQLEIKYTFVDLTEAVTDWRDSCARPARWACVLQKHTGRHGERCAVWHIVEKRVQRFLCQVTETGGVRG